MELMAFLANNPWKSILPASITLTDADASTEISLEPYPSLADSKLRIEYAVLGLYQTGVAIAQGGKFYELKASIYVKDLQVGSLEFRPSRFAPPGSSNGHSLSLNHTNDTEDSAIIHDPDDNKFAITYEWDGVRIKAQDVFTVILDGYAVAAEHKNTDIDAYIPAARSASGATVLSTWTVGDVGNPYMTWGLLKKAISLIWDLLILGPVGQRTRFEGFVFGLQYEGKDIGAGRMLRFDANSEGDVGSVAEK